MILHVDMDAFFASIEQAINPRLKGKPLIVGSRGSKAHTVVCAASYEAKALGIHSGMPSVEAFRICPWLEFVPAEQAKYIWTSEQILEMLKAYKLPLQYASIDEFQLDIGAQEDPLKIAQDIQKEIRETFKITASIGIAKNCLLAKLASKLRKPNGILALTDTNLKEALEATPVEKIAGIGPKTTLVIQGLGIKSCWDLYQKSPQFLSKIFGKNGLNLYAGLHGIDRLEASEESEKPKSIGHSYTLPWASQNPVFIESWIRLLSEMVARRLREQKLLSKTTHLWLSFGFERGGFGAQKTSDLATNDGYEVWQRCLKIGAKIGKKWPKIRALGVTCSGLEYDYYPPLFTEQRRRVDLLKAVDKINGRFGESSIYPAIISFTKRMR